MAGFNFGGFEQALSETRGNGVSFEAQANKWETENEGLIFVQLFSNFHQFKKKSINHRQFCLAIHSKRSH